jgi:hypothetical protein
MRYIFIFLIILLQACASATGIRVEGSDFKENLPGLWEGRWRGSGVQGMEQIKIIKVEGNEVHLTGFMGGGGEEADTDKVYGRIEGATLVLTWPEGWGSGCKGKYFMNRDASNNLTLVGNQSCSNAVVNVLLRKIK